MMKSASILCRPIALGPWGFFVILLFTNPIFADQGQPEDRVRTRVVPLVFSSDNTQIAYGLGGVSIGAGQPQAALFALGFVSENDSSAVSVGALNYWIPGIRNLYFSGLFYRSDMPRYRYFSGDDPGYAIRANDSIPTFTTVGLNDSVARIQARWVLPIGAAKREDFSLSRRAILPEQPQPAISLHPTKSGVSSIRFEWETYERDFSQSGASSDSGSDVFRLKFDWDNTGSRLIPNSGGRIRLGSEWGKNRGDQNGRWRLYQGAITGFFAVPSWPCRSYLLGVQRSKIYSVINR